MQSFFEFLVSVIIIMSCRQHGYPWPSLATSPYHSSPPAGLQGYILCLHIAAVCKFELVVLLLLGHMWGVHRSTSLTSSSLLLQQCPACLVRLTCIVFMMGGKCPYSWCLVGCCHQNKSQLINHYYIYRLHLFWDSFKWFCLQICSDANIFSSHVQGIVIED